MQPCSITISPRRPSPAVAGDVEPVAARARRAGIAPVEEAARRRATAGRGGAEAGQRPGQPFEPQPASARPQGADDLASGFRIRSARGGTAPRPECRGRPMPGFGARQSRGCERALDDGGRRPPGRRTAARWSRGGSPRRNHRSSSCPFCRWRGLFDPSGQSGLDLAGSPAAPRAPSASRSSASASSGVTSGAMRTKPTTLTCSISPAARAASSSATPSSRRPTSSVCRSIERDTSADWLRELVADRRPDEVGPVGEEPLLHQEVDPAEVDVAEVDRDLLAVGSAFPEL